MKKVLSFVLVLAMVLGSVSMAFAATNYADQAQITNTEAVDVLSTLKVLEGDANGFRPQDTLTRAEAAAIIARLVLGRDEADKLAKASTQFSDVPATHWAAGYINYCVSEGIIAGNGDGTFSPDGLLTVPAFTKMILCALGYNAQTEGLVGPNWEAATASLAVKAGVTVDATGNCTRETAALLGLKALEADVVAYDQAAVTVNAGGAQVVVGGSSAKAVAVKDSAGGTAPKYNGVADGVQQLAEKVYKDKLVKDPNATDDYGRAANKWTYKGDKIGTYGNAKDAEKVYTGKTSESTIAKSYKASDFDATGAAIIVNGDTTPGTTAAISAIAALTHNGRTVEIYKKDGKINKIVASDKFLAEVTAVNASSEKNTYKAKAGVGGVVSLPTLNASEKGYGTFKKGDFVIVTIAKNGANYDVESVAPATKITGVINGVETETVAPNVVAKTVTIDGTKYTAAWNAIDNASASDKTFDAYLDADSIVYYIPESSATKNYVVIAQAATVNDELGQSVWKAQATFMDGTIANITLKDGSVSAAGIYAYTISSSKYVLTAPGLYAHTSTQALNDKVTVLNGAHYFSDNTNVYLVKNAGKTNASVTAYKGAQKLATTAAVNIYYLTDKESNGTTSASITTAIIFTDVKAKNTTSDVVYANKSAAVGSTMVGSNSKSQYEVYINGVKATVTAEGDPTAYTFYEPTTDSDGVYTWGSSVNSSTKVGNASIAAAYAGNISVVGLESGKTLKVAEDVVVVDLRSGLYDDDKMSSFDQIVDYIADHGTLLKASVVYNDAKDVEAVTYIFLTEGQAQHTF